MYPQTARDTGIAAEVQQVEQFRQKHFPNAVWITFDTSFEDSGDEIYMDVEYCDARDEDDNPLSSLKPDELNDDLENLDLRFRRGFEF